MNREQIIDLLHASACSCVIANGERIESFHERGVKDLHRLLYDDRALLDGAFIADKVVGKGAAALMVAGGVQSVYTDVISQGALTLFSQSGVEVEYGVLVENIINRTGTDICPVEKLCKDCLTAEECLPLISKFIESMKR